ncbi:MAG: hypothetical protein EZS28_054099 [Streblomastix strix]|uniref:Uncharacterized protein n=1 Tax=Streblomastix strix TaxID=222440 RepID=A0A5J4QWP5_9EUKA|nr:MAG: hypothetical protein EZS28_054099 [Streblomastix strix]
MLNPGSFSHKYYIKWSRWHLQQFATFMLNSGASAINTVLLDSDAIYSNRYFHAESQKLQPQIDCYIHAESW